MRIIRGALKNADTRAHGQRCEFNWPLWGQVLVFLDPVQWGWIQPGLGPKVMPGAFEGMCHGISSHDSTNKGIEESHFAEKEIVFLRCHDFPRATPLRCRGVYFISDIVFGNCGLEKLIQFHSNKMVYLWNVFLPSAPLKIEWQVPLWNCRECDPKWTTDKKWN